jgi:pseudoazurin
MRKVMTLATIAALTTIAGAAAEVEVKMLNKGAEGLMVFEPALVKIEPGDTVKFVATDKGHNAESIKGMFPADAVPFVGKNGEDVTVTFDKPGAYGREMHAALWHGHGGTCRGGNAGQPCRGQGGSSSRQGESGVRGAIRETSHASRREVSCKQL